MKKTKRGLACLLICALFLTNAPLSTFAENNVTENLEQESIVVPDAPVELEEAQPVVEEQPETGREPLDFTGDREEVGIDFYRAVYQAEDQTELTVNVNQESRQLDLTNVAAETLRFDVSIRFLRDKQAWQMKGNDTVQFTLPQTYFKLEDTQAPIPVYNSVLEDIALPTDIQVAEYSVVDNVVTVTIHSNVEQEDLSYVFASLQLQANIIKEALNKDNTTAAAIDGTKYSVLLPKAESEIKEPEVTQPEVTEPQEKQPEVKQSEEKAEADEPVKDQITNTDNTATETDKDNSEDNKGNLLSEIRAAFANFVDFFSAEKEAVKGLTTSYEFGKEKDNLPKGFDTIELSVTSKEDGYKKGDTDLKVGLGITVFMNDDDLYSTSEEVIQNYGDFPYEPEKNINEWIKEIDKWRGNNPDVIPDYTFSYDLGEYFQDQDVAEEEIVLTREGEQDITIGSYKVSNGVLTIAVHPVCSFMDSVYFKETMEVSINGDKLSDGSQEVVMGNDGKLVFQSEGTHGGGTDKPEDVKFEVKKEGPSKVTDTSIEYKITVNSLKEKENLNGKTLKDIVPEGLEVTKGSVLLNGKVKKEVKDSEGNPSASYTFEAYDESKNNAITSAVFTFSMELTQAQYQDYIKNGIDTTFKNKAELSGKDPAEQKIVSEEIATKMTSRFFNKSGKSENIEGTRYAWKIQLNTKLSAMNDGYVVDTLCETDHQYDFEKGIDVQTEEGTFRISEFEKLESELSWGALTADEIKTLVPDSTFAKKAYYYTIDEKDNEGKEIRNPFYPGTNTDTGEPEFKQRTILIIPYKGLQGTDTSKAVTIHYSTDINTHGLTPESYWEKIQTEGSKPVINNNANLLWNNKIGEVGPTSPTQDEVDFGKTVDTNPGAVVKKGVNYNPAMQRLTWNVEVNKLGSNMKNVVLTDTLAVGDYVVSDSLDIKWFSYYSGGAGLQASGSLPKGEDNQDQKGRYYTLSTSSTGETEIKIYLGDVGEIPDVPDQYEFYKLQFSLKLTDPDILAVQNQDHKKSNTIKMQAQVGAEGKEYKDTGEQLTPNVLIEKEAVGAYNYSTFELPWKITVNPNKLHIMNAEVTDTMEAGFVFGKVTKVEKNGEIDDEMLGRIVGQNDEGSAEAPAFTLGEIKDTYTIYVTTKTTEEWRDDNLSRGDGAQRSIDVPNHAKLDGTIYGKAIEAQDDAAHKIIKEPVGKSGVYNKEAGTITWTIEVNKAHANVAGLKLVETLNAAEGKVVHELDPDTIQIKKVKYDDAGKEILTSVTYTDSDLTPLDANGFTYQFPDESSDMTKKNYEQYRFVFVTNLTADAKDAKILNKVYIKDQADNDINQSGTSDGGYDGDYEFNKNVHAQGRPRVILRKISKNSADDVDNNKNFGLDGAEFSLEVCKFSVDEGMKELTIGETVHKYDKVRISKNGEAYFPNIKTATQEVTDKSNLICVLKEEKAAPGYNKDAQPHFVYFATVDGNMIKMEPESINYDGKVCHVGTDAFYQYKEMDNTGSAEGAMVVMENSPKDSTFTFNKQQVKLTSYEYSGGSATSETEDAAGVTFTGKAIDEDATGKLKTFEVTSDPSGKVTIKNLDAGTYLLTETAPNEGHKPGTVKLQVTWNKTSKNYDYSFVPNSATGGIKINTDGKLNNELNTGKVEFTKYVKYEDGRDDEIVKDSNNREKLAGVKFRLQKAADSTGGPQKVNLETFSTSDGKVVFDGLPIGEYDIYEVYGSDALPGYETNDTEEKVYHVKVTEDTSKETRPVTATFTPQKATDDINSIHNTAIKGTITFTKKSKDNVLSGLDGKPIEGAEFGMFRKIGDKTAGQPIYRATSDVDGKVEFTNVEYGNYVLKETKTPKGYKAIAAKDITKDMLAPVSNTFAYNAGVLYDETLKATLSLVKKDADNAGMSDISFQIYRRGDKIVGENGEDMKMVVPDSTRDFYRYMPKESVTSAVDGTIVLNDIPYGDYLLVEDTSGVELQDGADKVALILNVKEGEGVVEVVTTISGSGNAGLTQNTSKNGYTNVDTSKFTPYTEKEGDKIKVVNQKKYGFVNVKKAAGQRKNNVDTSLIPHPKKDSPAFVAGAVFEISKRSSGGTYEKYLTLETNSKGEFDSSQTGNTKGAYKDKDSGKYKHLWYGSYKIKEISAPTAFEVDTRETEFTIGDTGNAFAGHEGTAWISFDGKNSRVQYVKKGMDVPRVFYLNEVVTGGFYISKLEKDSLKSLSGAQFVVLTEDGKEIAALKEKTSVKGEYELTNQKFTGGTYNEMNDSNLAYLQTVGETHLLLPGTYLIEEIKPPAGYKTMTEKKEVTVVKGENSKKVEIENESFAISIVKKSIDSAVTAELSGAEFILAGNFSDTTSKEKILTDSNKTNLTGLIVGEAYRLTEKKAPKGYSRHSSDVTFTIGSDGSIQNLQALHSTKDQITASGQVIIFKNQPNELTLEKRATDIKPGESGDANLLDGARFTITNKNDAADSFTVAAAGGKVTIKGKLTGGATYLLREIEAPEDYAVNKNDITFTMGEDGKVNGTGSTDNRITVYDEPIRLSFVKVGKFNESCKTTDPDAVRPLEGVVFGVYAKAEPDQLINTAKSDKSGKVVFPKLSKGSYIVREISTVQGYRLDTSEYYAEITESEFEGLKIRDKDGTLVLVEHNQVINDVYRADITFTKVSEQDNNKVLEGSEYGLYKYKSAERSGSGLRPLWTLFSAEETIDELVLVSTAVTDEKGVLIFPGVLVDTEYVVKELRAPDGSYISKNPMKITFGTERDDSGNVKIKVIHVDDGSGTVQVDPETGEIIWLEPEVVVHFLKQTPDKTMLANAVLELQDEKGTVIETWRSKKEAYVISGKLIIGQTYRLVEKTAPDGYQIAEPVEFMIAEDEVGPNQKKIQEVIMIDKPVEAVIPNPPETEDPKDPPKEDPKDSTKENNNTKVTPTVKATPAVKTENKIATIIKTGDTQSITLWLVFLLGSAGLGVFLVRKKRIANRDKKSK